MSPRTTEQFEKMRETSRTTILQTALKLFAVSGYHTTSIDKIAKKAKISKGLMYNYFKSKEALLEAVLMEKLDELFGEFDMGALPPDPRKALKMLFDAVFSIADSEMEIWRLYFSLVMQPGVPKKLQVAFMHRLEALIGLMAGLLKTAGYKDARMEANILAASLDGIFLYHMFHPEQFPMDKIKRKFIEKYCKE